MHPDRIACIYLPEFPLHVCLRANTGNPELPAVVTNEDKTASRIISLNQAARDQRVSVNMTVAQARVYCADLQVFVRDLDLEEQEVERILSLLQQVGPCVEVSDDGVFYIEISGLMRLYRDEEGVIAQLLRVLKPIEYPFMIGIGCNKLIAGIAARVSSVGGCITVPPGKEREFLDPLYVTSLQLPDETALKLHELGIRTINDLSKFPSHEITLRFGDEVVALAKYARGEDPSLFLPERLSSIRTSRRILDFPIISRTVLLAFLKELFEELLGPLRAVSEGAKALTIICYCQDGSSQTLPVKLDNPTGSTMLFCRQVAVSLESLNVSDGISEILVVLTGPARLTGEQLDLDSRKNNSGSNGCAHELTERSVYAITPMQRNLPEERFTLTDPNISPVSPKQEIEKNGQQTYYTMHPLVGMRMLSEPKASTIETKSGRLLAVYIKGKRFPVLNQKGPWRLSGGWWSRGFERLYYDIETSRHQSLLVFYDLEESTWYLQGVFD